MKKNLIVIYIVIVALLCCAFGMIGCETANDGDNKCKGTNIAVASVTLNKSSIALNIGESEILTATVSPTNATDKKVVWTSTAPSVATVDENGKVTAVSSGKAYITARAEGKQALCVVTVNKQNGEAPSVAVTSVTLNKNSITLDIGGSEVLIATVTPDNATDKEVVWISSAPSVAAVDENGIVIALSSGIAYVTAIADGKQAICEVTVTKQNEEPPAVAVTSVTLNKTATTLDVGQSETLTVTVNPFDATNKTVSWTSTSPSVATVDGNGKVTAVAAGTATIIARVETKNATCYVTVNKQNEEQPAVAVTSVTLNKTATTLDIGQSETLTATVNPSNATHKTVVWTSSAPSVAAVDENGKVAAVATGSATVTARVGTKSADCVVSVTNKAGTAGLAYSLLSNQTAYKCTGLGTATANDIVIATEYNGLPVTEIDERAFNNRDNITSVTIPAPITKIGDYAFEGCNALENLTLSNRLTAIGRRAFSGCSQLTAAVLSEGITTIGERAFGGCNITSFVIPRSVTSLGGNVFCNCTNLTKLYWNAVNCSVGTTIPPVSDNNGVTEIILGEGVIGLSKGLNNAIKSFDDYKKLKKITVNSGNANYSSQSGILYNKAGTELLYIPVAIEGEVVLPDGLTALGTYAFNNCSKITSVTLPSSIQSIGAGAFNGCTALNDIYYSGDLADWCLIQFKCAPLAVANNLHINNTLITEVVIPDGVTELNYGPFSGSTSITSIVVPNSVTFIEENALGGCSGLVDLSIPFVGTTEKIFGVKYSEFGSIFGYEDNQYRYNCNVPSSLKNVVVTGGASIASNAFEDCYYIENVTFPNTVTSVGSSAFADCRGLKGVHIGDIASWCGISFTDSTSNPLHRAKKLYVNEQLVTDLSVPDGVTSIGSYVFYNCSGIENISIADSVTSIGTDAFTYTAYYNDEANWQDNVLYIDKHLIKAKSSLGGSFTVKDETITIAGRAFEYCSISQIVMPDTVVFIGNGAFADCYSLRNVTMSTGLKTIGNSVFGDCDNLVSITLPAGITTIGYNAFGACSIIYYSGNMDQWKHINKNSSWTTLSSVTVTCSDGKLDKYDKEKS